MTSYFFCRFLVDTSHQKERRNSITQKLKSNNGNDSIYSGFFHSYAYEERRDYEKYKSGSLDELSEDRLVQMEVLDVLEKLSFPMDKMGTYLYKDMIVKVMRYLNGVDDLGHDISEHELLQELILT